VTYAAVYQASRDLGYSEMESMAYATEPDLFAADHPEVPVEIYLGRATASWAPPTSPRSALWSSAAPVT
jgi:hypothetical protein